MKTLAALLFLIVATLPAADPGLVNLISPDATLIAGMNVEQAKTTPFGQYVLNMVVRDDRHLARFIEATGFDPRQDIREALIAWNGQRAGLVLLRGRFDQEKLSDVLQRLGGVREDYKGVPVLLGKRGNEALAVLDSSTAIGGTPAEVRAAIDRRATGSILSPATAVKVNQWSTSQHAWVVVQDFAGVTPRGPAHGPVNPEILTKLTEAAGGIQFGQLVQLSGEAMAETQQDATALADVVRMLAQLALVRNNDPDAAAVLRSLTVTAQDRTVKVSASIPEEKLEQIVRPPQRRPARVKPVAHRQ
jgi:hypothetical protein